MVMTHVQQLANFVSRASYEDLSENARQQLRIRVLDSLGCAIGALNGDGTTPAQQLSWWAGDPDPKTKLRQGQAPRFGYIVIAVDWMKVGQPRYQYSAREHATVLGSLRYACRRFSIDRCCGAPFST